MHVSVTCVMNLKRVVFATHGPYDIGYLHQRPRPCGVRAIYELPLSGPVQLEEPLTTAIDFLVIGTLALGCHLHSCHRLCLEGETKNKILP